MVAGTRYPDLRSVAVDCTDCSFAADNSNTLKYIINIYFEFGNETTDYSNL